MTPLASLLLLACMVTLAALAVRDRLLATDGLLCVRCRHQPAEGIDDLCAYCREDVDAMDERARLR